MVSVDFLDALFLLEMEDEALENGDKPSLTELPDLVLRKVTKELDFESVKNLRGACRRFLHLTPSRYEQLTGIHIKVDHRGTGVYFRIEDKTQKIMRILPSWQSWETLLLFDWDTIFQQRKTPMKIFSIEFERYQEHPDVSSLYKILRQILKSRPPILAENIYLDVSCHEDVLSILLHFDPRFLKAINLNTDLAYWLKKEFKIEALYGLEQWRKTEELNIWGAPEPDANSDMPNPFDHFSYIFVPWTWEMIKNRGVKKRRSCFKPVSRFEFAESSESLREMLRRNPDINYHEGGCTIS
ncbi:unnamed protein product [Caenorhabditis brenneri]